MAARWFDEFEGAGLDGVVAKPLELGYRPDKRVMIKVKHVRTADCVVAGYRTCKTDPLAVGSLLLGLDDEGGDLVFVGVVGVFAATRRRELLQELEPLVTTFEGHPWDWGDAGKTARTPQSAAASRWSAGKDLSFVPLRPERVVEVATTTWRGTVFATPRNSCGGGPTGTPRSCTFAQLEEPFRYDLSGVLT